MQEERSTRGLRARPGTGLALGRLIAKGGAPDLDDDHARRVWAQLDRDSAIAYLPLVRQEARHWARFLALIEAIAEGREGATCETCGERFYPSRSDAQYCSGRCRTRAYRKG